MTKIELAKISEGESSSMGLCAGCTHAVLVNTGNGVGDPLAPILMCAKRNFEIAPVPRGEEITECDFKDYTRN